MANTGSAKWHKRHVSIDTPCHIGELESILNAISSRGGWCEASVAVVDDRIVITFGDESDDGGMKMVNG